MRYHLNRERDGEPDLVDILASGEDDPGFDPAAASYIRQRQERQSPRLWEEDQ